MPGRFTPPMPESVSPQCAISALTSVPGLVPGGGMHHRPARLVDHDEVVVLVDNIERDVLGLRLAARRRRHLDADGVARIDALAGIADRAPADRDHAFENERLEAGARQAFDAGGEHAIEALAGIVGVATTVLLAREI